MICDWIWENPASMHNYKYLEIPIINIWSTVSRKGIELLACNLPHNVWKKGGDVSIYYSCMHYAKPWPHSDISSCYCQSFHMHSGMILLYLAVPVFFGVCVQYLWINLKIKLLGLGKVSSYVPGK